MRVLLTSTAAALLALAGTASAATVRTETICYPPVKGMDQGCVVNVHFAAAPGEANDVTVTAEAGGFRIADTGAPVEPQGSCARVDDNTVTCPDGNLHLVTGDGDDGVVGPGNRGQASLGPGDDRATTLSFASGGEGDDAFMGTAAGETFHGDAGNDVLRGEGGPDDLVPGPGADVTEGGDGNDRITATEAADPLSADRLDGGPGEDLLSYGGAVHTVSVDLARGTYAGEAGGDTSTGIENLEGGLGSDSLAGDDGPNKIDGGAGGNELHGAGGDDELRGYDLADTIEGGSGDDVVSGGLGFDRVYGGEGDDLVSKEGGRGVIQGDAGDDLLSYLGEDGGAGLRFACGEGADVVDAAKQAAIRSDCEELAFGDTHDGELSLPLLGFPRVAVATVRADRGHRGRITLRDRLTGRRLGTKRFVGRGRRVKVRVRIALPRSASRRLRATGRLRAVAEVADLTTDAGGAEAALVPIVAPMPAERRPVARSAARCAFTDIDGFPAVHGGQAYGLSCGTARAVGNAIQRGHARTQRQPTRLRARGMRFRCRYRFYTEGDGQLQRATCRRTSRPAQRVVLKLSA